ncbi:CAROTENOID CLEAVAGE DIOXYGENASE 4 CHLOROPLASTIC-RELATED [Salix purpurea]|uniref:CAROTENOID CLEAVAGE DIOXYGENASE 4 CHLOROPLASTIC-RELATED n=1 Tax=Salix purpurea TaxID=77065 RepID=A0A9Q0PRL5_SALPP|nr:CAROTENOID CLEAVAGE DIOXYGENASE 4 CHLOROPLASTIC-RELATED [Salix purpurea]
MSCIINSFFSSNLHTLPKPIPKTFPSTFPGIPQLGARLPYRRQGTRVPVLSSQADNAGTGSSLEKISLSNPSVLLCSCLSAFLIKHLSTTISKFIDHPPLDPSVDPYQVFSGNFAPVDELEPTNCTVVEGELPCCLNGVYIRNGSNPQKMPNGPLHFFEGDGMLHSLKLSGGQATYCSRYVRTYKYLLEREAGFSIFPNILSGFYCPHDVLSYVMAVGRLLALCESDLPYVISLTQEGDMETLGRWDFDRKLLASMTAHPKVDEDTRETFAFQCNPSFFPHVTYFYFDENGVKQKDVPLLSINQPTPIHDFAITKRFAIFPETQLVVEPANVMLGRGMPVVCEQKKVPRIGILPRYAESGSDTRWFPVPGFNAMHVTNAWENGDDEVVVVAPNVLNIRNVFQEIEKVHFSLEKLTINMRTEKVSRKILSKRSLELGSINPYYIGKKNRYAYLGIAEKVPKMSGLAKIDLEKECEVSRRLYGPGCFGGEPFFVSREANAPKPYEDEDDGFVVSYVHDETSGQSNFIVMDAKSPNLDIVAKVELPRRVPYGFHGLFVRKNSFSDN